MAPASGCCSAYVHAASCQWDRFSPPAPTLSWLLAQGVASLCLSWVFSPVLGAALAAFLFFFLRLLVLRRQVWCRAGWEGARSGRRADTQKAMSALCAV